LSGNKRGQFFETKNPPTSLYQSEGSAKKGKFPLCERETWGDFPLLKCEKIYAYL